MTLAFYSSQVGRIQGSQREEVRQHPGEQRRGFAGDDRLAAGPGTEAGRLGDPEGKG